MIQPSVIKCEECGAISPYQPLEHQLVRIYAGPAISKDGSAERPNYLAQPVRYTPGAADFEVIDEPQSKITVTETQGRTDIHHGLVVVASRRGEGRWTFTWKGVSMSDAKPSKCCRGS